MAAVTPQLGNGIAMVLGTWAFLVKIMTFSFNTGERVTVDASDCSTLGYKPFLIAPDIDPGEFNVTVRHDSDLDVGPGLIGTGPPTTNITFTAMTVTFPDGEVLSFANAVIKNFGFSGGKDQPIDSTFSIKLSGTVTF